MRAVKVTGLLAVVAALLAMPGAALANSPIMPPQADVSDHNVRNEALPPGLAAGDARRGAGQRSDRQGLPNQMWATIVERGVIIHPGLLLIIFGDGSQESTR